MKFYGSPMSPHQISCILLSLIYSDDSLTSRTLKKSTLILYHAYDIEFDNALSRMCSRMYLVNGSHDPSIHFLSLWN